MNKICHEIKEYFLLVLFVPTSLLAEICYAMARSYMLCPVELDATSLHRIAEPALPLSAVYVALHQCEQQLIHCDTGRSFFT